MIEVDGDSHFTPEAQVKDEKRTDILQGYGLTVIRFTNDDVLNNLEGVSEIIYGWLDPSSSYPP